MDCCMSNNAQWHFQNSQGKVDGWAIALAWVLGSEPTRGRRELSTSLESHYHRESLEPGVIFWIFTGCFPTFFNSYYSTQLFHFTFVLKWFLSPFFFPGTRVRLHHYLLDNFYLAVSFSTLFIYISKLFFLLFLLLQCWRRTRYCIHMLFPSSYFAAHNVL